MTVVRVHKPSSCPTDCTFCFSYRFLIYIIKRYDIYSWKNVDLYVCPASSWGLRASDSLSGGREFESRSLHLEPETKLWWGKGGFLVVERVLRPLAHGIVEPITALVSHLSQLNRILLKLTASNEKNPFVTILLHKKLRRILCWMAFVAISLNAVHKILRL